MSGISRFLEFHHSGWELVKVVGQMLPVGPAGRCVLQQAHTFNTLCVHLQTEHVEGGAAAQGYEFLISEEAHIPGCGIHDNARLWPQDIDKSFTVLPIRCRDEALLTCNYAGICPSLKPSVLRDSWCPCPCSDCLHIQNVSLSV